MADENSKTEEATPYKLEEAKKKGQVHKSVELTGLLMLISFVFAITVLGRDIFSFILEKFSLMLRNSSVWSLNGTNAPVYFESTSSEFIYAFSGLIVVLVLSAIIFNVLQTGFIVSSHPITPDWTRLNPKQGLEKIISRKTFLDFIKVILKLSIIIIYFRFCAMDWLSRFEAGYGLRFELLIRHWYELAILVAVITISLLFPITIFDYIVTKFEFSKKMMMSKQDVKDEYKKREGDPQVRQKQKQIQKEMLKKSESLRNVSDADVIISNPIHISVALQYDSTTMVAPKVVSIGEDLNSKKIQDMARIYNVPIIINVPLARKLYASCNLNQCIPEDVYVDVAKIFRRVLREMPA